jgi:hypothetical protein
MVTKVNTTVIDGTNANVSYATNAGTATNANNLGGVPAASFAQTANLPAGGFSNMQVFTSSGTFTVPAGITKVKVTVISGGGGGGGFSVNGGAGGTSSFGAFCSATGGGGGARRSVGGQPGVPGVGSGGNLNFTGSSNNSALGYGAVSYSASLNGLGYGGGGAGGGDDPGGTGGCGGGTIEIISGLTSGGTVSVTVGGGGSAGDSSGAGSAGVVVVEW